MRSGSYAQWLATENRSRGFQGRVVPLVAGRVFMPSPSLDSSADLYVPMRIHRKMLLGRKSVRPDAFGSRAFSLFLTSIHDRSYAS